MWIDITQTLKKGIPNWPGDTPFTYETVYSKAQTGSVNIGRMETSLHTGTHADAPFHFNSEAETMEQLVVNVFIGTCFVIDCIGQERITAEWLREKEFHLVERILLKTVPAISGEFPKRVSVIEPDVAQLLKERGVKLLGIDVPSVDPLDSKEVATHHTLYAAGVYIVEGLVLEQLEPGLYDFIGLPLKIEGADGAPVRAVVRKVD